MFLKSSPLSIGKMLWNKITFVILGKCFGRSPLSIGKMFWNKITFVWYENVLE